MYYVAAAFVAVMITGCAVLEQSSRSRHASHPGISIYSPAAPPNMLWSINKEIGAKLESCGVGEDVSVIPSALPDSINSIGQMSDRALHLPIVTTADFSPAVKGTGAHWHAYVRAYDDLKFVASLYEVGIGVMIFDDDIREPADLKGKKIAVPRRPSSLRVMAETLLGDGWGVLDDVVLVDMPPSEVAGAAADGHIDATTWNLMAQTPDGFRPLLPALPTTGRWLSVSKNDIERINSNNDFATDAVVIAGAPANVNPNAIPNATANGAMLLSFRQGLAAWSTTSDAQVLAIVRCLEKADGASALHNWPGLDEAAVHPAALKFYRQSNPDFLKVKDAKS